MFVINADDFGYNSDYNKAIMCCFENSLIHYSSLMVNMPGTEEAVSLVKQHNLGNSIGLHLNLSEGCPLTREMRDDPIFCNQCGMYDRFFKKNLLFRFWLPKKSRQNLEREITAQIDKYMSFGFTRLHIDSHHHVHKYYSVYKILIRILQKYDWKTIRIALNTSKSSGFHGAYNAWINKKIKKSCIQPFSNYLFSNLESALACANSLSSICEVEVHPKMIDSFVFDYNTPMIMANEIKGK